MPAQPPALGQVVQIKIERLAYHSGHGVGRMDGFVVFVPFTAPGDEVSAEITELHKSYAVAKMTKLVQRGVSRREPPCPVAGVCGGCAWQQVTYDEQVRQKSQLLKDNLRNLNRFGPIEFRPFLAAPEEFRYRNRIQVHRRGREIGFFAAGTRDLVPVTDCWLAESEIVQAMNQLAARAEEPGAEIEERVEIARRPDGIVEVDASPGEGTAGRFAQVNNRQNELLIRILREAVRGSEFRRVIDLFCGAGNLTFPLAEEAGSARIEGVELSKVLIERAKAAAKPHPARDRIAWHSMPAGQYLRSARVLKDTLLVLDPPRPGCDKETRAGILKLAPERIVYVSCNPTTLARDAESWLATGKYRVEFAQGLDMFPQTAHLEAILALRLDSASH
jgi:tRNA/tmRNA/rRNA uracil-C5-methylase (TrmA/RlmC/RlmD family)